MPYCVCDDVSYYACLAEPQDDSQPHVVDLDQPGGLVLDEGVRQVPEPVAAVVVAEEEGRRRASEGAGILDKRVK